MFARGGPVAFRLRTGDRHGMTTTYHDTPGLRLEREGPVARLLIDRADKRNAMSSAMWAAVPALVGAAMADPAVRVLVVQSATPGLFCAGADIAEMVARREDAAWLAANQAAINRAQHELTRALKPTVAFIDGDCIGGGAGLALACDIRVASPQARFGVTPARLGLVYPLHDTKLLIDLIGPSFAMEMFFTGRQFTAEEARGMGLVNRVVADDALETIVGEMARQIADNAPLTVKAAKLVVRELVKDVADRDVAACDAAVKACFASADYKEGQAAFIEKRKPKFTGR